MGVGNLLKHGFEKKQVMMGTEGFLNNSGWNRHC